MESLFTAVTSAGGCVVFVLAAALLRVRSARGAKAMAAALFSMSGWIWFAALEPYVGDFALYMGVVKAKYSAVAITPACTALGIYGYTTRKRVPRALWLAALALPVITVGLTWTNDLHGWMWAHPPFDPDGERTMLLPWGPWFWRAHLPYSYAAAAFALAVLCRELVHPSELDRPQLGLLLAGVLFPLVTNVTFTLGILPWRVGPTPLAITVSGLLFAWGFLRRGLFRLSSVAYQAVFEQMRHGVLVADAEGRIQLANPAALAITGRDEPALRGALIGEVLPRDENLRGLLDGSASAALLSRSGDDRYLEIAMSPLRDGKGALGGRIFLLRDVSERERAARTFRRGDAFVRGLIEHSPNGILRLTPRRDETGEVRDFVCAFANGAAAQQLGRSVETLTGRPFKGAVHPHTAGLFQAFRDAMRTGERRELERAFSGGGRERWLRFIAVPTDEDLGVTCVDVTDAKLREQAMQAAASEDALTGLLNRRGLEADAPSVLGDPSGEPRRCGVLYMDLDDFKRVNDGLGHAAGDLVLCEFAARLQTCTRGPDLLARLGGDEFVVLLPDVGLDGALWVAERILEAANEPVRIGEREIRCVPSIGVALQPESGTSLKALLEAADRVMYEAKSGAHGIRVAVPRPS